MFQQIRRPKRFFAASVVAFCSWTGIFPGIYGAYDSAMAATALVQNARTGQGVGTDILDEASSDAATQGQSDFDSLGMTSPAGWKSKLESYYISDNAGLTPGNNLNQYAAAEGAILHDTTCPSNWGTVQQGLSESAADYKQMISVCTQRISAFASIASSDTSDPAIVTEAEGDLSSWESDTESAESTVNTVADDCASAPACDITSSSNVESVTNLWTSTTNGFPELEAYCASLPQSPSLSEVSQESADITSIVNALNNLGYGNSAIKSVGSACSYAKAYVASESGMTSLNDYTDPTSAYGSEMHMSTIEDTPQGQAMVNAFTPFIKANPEVFEQYYNPADCVKKTTYYTNQSGTATTPPTTVIQSGSNSNKPVACNTSGLHNGWVTNFPDPNASYIWGGYNDCQNVPNGDTETFEAVYNNGGNGGTQNAPISATMYLAIDDQGTVTIQGSATGETEQVSYSDDGGNPISANPPDGWISSPVTLYPGSNFITITDKNDDSGTSASNPAGALMAIMGSSGQVYIATNTTQWNWVDAPTSPVTTTTEPGTTVSTGEPSASATSDLCTNTISCLGTQCHALINNQNLDFNQAVTDSSALSMMQTGMTCEAGTSVSAGNCIPVVFSGKEYYCRTWPFSNVGITNNCCKEGMQGASMGISQGIQIVMDTYRISENKIFQGTILGDPSKWVNSAWGDISGDLSTYASDAWRFVSSPFVGLAESFMQTTAQTASESGVLYSSISSYESAALNSSTSAITGAAGSSGGVFSFISNAETYVVGKIESYAVDFLMKMGMTEGAAIGTVMFIADAVNVIMLAYTAFQLLQLIGQLLTSCKKEEFTFGNYRKEDDCYIVGTYCAEHAPIIGCIMHKTTACCYQSPLAMIIASQIQTGQPNVAGGYGQPKDPNCIGFTIQQLSKVNWTDINLSQWLAIIEKAGLIQSTNSAAAAAFNQNTQDHPSGEVSVPNPG